MTQEVNQAQEEMVELESVDQFFLVLANWHDRQIQTALHMTQIPEGSEVQLNDGATLKLEGDALKGFQAGIATMLNLFGKLPISPIVEEDGQQTT